MSDEDDNIQRNEYNMRDINSSVFCHELINFIIPYNNTARVAMSTDKERARRIFDIDMQNAVTYLRQIYRKLAHEIFSEIVRQDRLDIDFFNWYAPALRDHLFRSGVRYETFLHFSVYLVCLTLLFKLHGVYYAPESVYSVVNGVLPGRYPPYDIEALRRVAQNYAYFHNAAGAVKGSEVVCTYSIAAANARDSLDITKCITRSSQKIMKFDRRYHIRKKRLLTGDDETVHSDEYIVPVGNPLVRLITKSVFSLPRYGKRRRRRAVKNNTGNKKSRITSPPLDYIAIPGTSRDTNPGVIHPNSEDDQLLPTTSFRAQSCNTSELSESGSSEKENFSLNNQVIQYKKFRNKTTSSESIESSTSSDTE